MKLDDSDVLAFQKLCKQKLGIDLAWSDAQAQAIGLVRLMKLTYKPMKISEYESLKNEDENEYEQSRPEILR